ncbi:MAG: hypothetical protein EpisKO_15510 [Epibacterium sp.]
MRLLTTLALSLIATHTFAFDGGHDTCIDMVGKVYEGTQVARGDEFALNSYLFDQVLTKRLNMEVKEEIDAQYAAFMEAAEKLIDTLSKGCEQIRTSSP